MAESLKRNFYDNPFIFLKNIFSNFYSLLDFDKLVKLISEEMNKFFMTEICFIYTITPDKKNLKIENFNGLKISSDFGIVSKTLKEKKPYYLNKIDISDPLFNGEVVLQLIGKVSNFLCCPLLENNKITGIILLINKKDGPFSDEIQSSIEKISPLIATSLANSIKTDKDKKESEETSLLRKLLHHKIKEMDFLCFLEVLINEERPLTELFDSILNKSSEIMEADAVSIALCSDDKEYLNVYCNSTSMQAKIDKFKLKANSGILGKVISTGESLMTNNASSDSRHDQNKARQLNFTVENILCVPIYKGEEVFGALEFLNSKKRELEYNEEDMKMASLIAGHITRLLLIYKEKEEKKKAVNLTTIGSMLSGIIHDFKTPMTVLSGLFFLTVSEESEAERSRNYEDAKKQIQQMNSMMQETLDFARGKTTLFPRKLFVADFIKEIEGMVLKLYQGVHNLEFKISYSFNGSIRVDENKLKRAFINLIRNAVQAMPKGGCFSLNVFQEEDKFVAVFTDTGIGISPEIQENLFESFVTYGKKDGIGLGLAIVKNIIEQHKGTISFTSQVNKGTSFTIKLPIQ